MAAGEVTELFIEDIANIKVTWLIEEADENDDDEQRFQESLEPNNED